MGQATTAKVRLDAGKAARFSASAQSTDWFDSCCARRARFAVARAGRRCDPWPHSHAESGECRFILNTCGGSSSTASTWSTGTWFTGPLYWETARNWNATGSDHSSYGSTYGFDGDGVVLSAEIDNPDSFGFYQGVQMWDSGGLHLGTETARTHIPRTWTLATDGAFVSPTR
jgi:hypothetical protein